MGLILWLQIKYFHALHRLKLVGNLKQSLCEPLGFILRWQDALPATLLGRIRSRAHLSSWELASAEHLLAHVSVRVLYAHLMESNQAHRPHANEPSDTLIVSTSKRIFTPTEAIDRPPARSHSHTPSSPYLEASSEGRFLRERALLRANYLNSASLTGAPQMRMRIKGLFRKTRPSQLRTFVDNHSQPPSVINSRISPLAGQM